MKDHRMCSVTALSILRTVSYSLQQLKDMAADGCTVNQFMDELDAMQEQVGVIRRKVKETRWRT